MCKVKKLVHLQAEIEFFAISQNRAKILVAHVLDAE